MIIKTLFIFLGCLMAVNVNANADFPFREQYSDVQIMSVDELHKNYDKAVVIDVRSVHECSVIKINKAHCLPWSNMGFENYLSDFRLKKSQTPLVMYCNGHTCTKSYLAARVAKRKGFLNVYSMDAGIFDWAEKYPDLTTLLSETPLVRSKLISKKELSKKTISFSQFQELLNINAQLLIIDIREPRQRKKNQVILNSHEVRFVNFNHLVENVIKKGLWKNKNIVVLDAVGKQVRWLQYYLNKYGYLDYHFLDKGVSNKYLQRLLKNN